VPVKEISVVELAQRLGDPALPPPLLLDVREGWEIERARLPGAQWLPMQQIVARIHELDPQREMVVLCHHGGRSFQVVAYLERQGFAKVSNLRGGIDAWSTHVDAKVPRY
jgi:rhodanese-related sulfurtransferase